MNRLVWVTCASAILLMAGCSSKDKTGGSARPASPSGAARAEQVAREMRGNVHCPAKASTDRPAGAPVDDVVGVRPGMTWDEAANFVMCDNPMLVITENTSRGYNINTYGQHLRQGFDAKFAEARVVKTSQQILQDMENDSMRRGANTYVAPLRPGQVRYFVTTMGRPGEEKALSVAREEYFPTDKLPTVESVKQALITKYGEPSQVNGNNLWWEYDPAGGKIAQGSALLGACSINVSPDASTSLSMNCGVTVGAVIQPANENPGLAHSLAVSSQNGAAGIAILNGTEQALMAGDAARKTKELNAAAKNGQGPKL
ncbi:MAG TPA: hypothetical protein VGZ29_06425 [Terriglobia bacterium]|nr:hypothetical protein [Terriglobia bacterium]